VLVLDEPTNDLDLETLELLEDELVEWPGTLLLVSHDRAFLDNVVTSTLVFEGDGRVQEYVGGYEDWLRQRAVRSVRLQPDGTGSVRLQPDADRRGAPANRKLSYKEQRELDALPGRIEALESEQRALNARVAGPDFYKESRDAIAAALARVDALHRELADAYARWHDLDSRTPSRP
jgi:ATP-binding cassette subfamily F protein uup